MGAKTIGFAVADEDRPQLDELVAYFGNGNRSAYLRETLKIMNSVKLAEEKSPQSFMACGAIGGVDTAEGATPARRAAAGR